MTTAAKTLEERQQYTAVTRALLTSINEGREVTVSNVPYDVFVSACADFGGENVTPSTCDAVTHRFEGVVPRGRRNGGKPWSLAW